MAMKISFKQQCPSCEAMVPVKDSSQIGKKIECPKCKFRFVVEAPEDEEDDAPPEPKAKKPAAKGAITTTKGAPAKNGVKTAGKNGVGAKKAAKEDDEDDAPKKKGKKKDGAGGNKNLTIMIGLAVVALALLGVGAFFIFNKGDKDKPKSSSSSSNNSNNSNNNNAGANDPKNQGNNQQGNVPGADITNLLPNDTQLVKHVNINVRGASAPRPFFPSKMATALFSTPGTFNVEAFKQKFGFTLESVEQAIIAQNLKDNWVFSVLRTTQPIDRKYLTEKLKLVSAGNPAKPELEFFTAEGEFDDFSVAFFMNSKQRPMTVHFYDDNTLVLADRKVMEPFLATERKPLERTKPAEQSQQRPGGAMGAMGAIGGGVPPGAGVGGAGGVGIGVSGAAQIGTPNFGRQGQPPMGAIGTPPMAMGAMGAIGAPPMGVIGAPPMGVMGGVGAVGAPQIGAMGAMGGGALGGMFGQMGGGRPFPSPSDSYRTVDPAIKRVLDATEFKKAVVSAAGERALIKTLTNKVIDLYMDDLPSSLRKDTPRPTVPDVVAAGALVVRELGDGGFHVGTAIAFDTTIMAQAIESGTRLVAAQVLPQIEKGLNVKIKLLGGDGGGNLAGVMGAAGAMGAPPVGIMGGAGAIGAPPPVGVMGAVGGPPMGAIGAPPVGVMGGAGAIGAPPPAGVMGGALGVPPMGGALGVPPMGGAIGAPPAGVMGGGGAIGALGGQGGGQPGGNDMPDPDAGYFDPRSEGNVFLLMLHLKLNDERVHKDIVEQVEEGLAQGAVFLRNEATMVYHRSHRHQLAEALQKYLTEKNGQFPRGTYPREINDRSGAGKGDNPLPFRPDERIAWTAELLPYLGEYSRLNVNRRKSWNEGMNRVAATTAVPHFLAPDEPRGRYPGDSWKVPMPGVPLAAVSHFVGVAGVGLDSALLAKEDDHPEGWKLRGVFGYDRVTKMSDIKDGAANTIAVLQVPATFKTCWLAGGGSTVRGVPEDNPLEPFICTEHQGKPGTFAIMCDGKVRFIPADMNAETFKALCTIAAGDKVDNLDAVAPVVDQAALVAKKDDPAPPLPIQPMPEQPKPMTPPVEQPKPMAGGALTPQLRQNDLKQIGLAYHNYLSTFNKAPAKAEDLGPFLENDARMLGRLKSGEIVFFWNVGINQMTEGTSRTVLAYEKEVPSAGGFVLFGDGSVKRVQVQEFQAAPKAGR